MCALAEVLDGELELTHLRIGQDPAAPHTPA
jgi:hypothetical protein